MAEVQPSGLDSAVQGSLPALNLLGLRDYGAKGDGKTVADATTTAASTTVTSPTAAWVASDVGKPIAIRAAGAAGAPLVTTIAAVNSGTSIDLTVAAGSSIAGTASLVWGTDDTAAVIAWINAYNAAGGGLAYINGIVGNRFVLANLDSTPLPSWTAKGQVFGSAPRLSIFEDFSRTADCFTRAGDHIYYADFEIRCSPAQPTAGALMRFASGQLGGLANVRLSSGWNNFQCDSAYNWTIDEDCYNVDYKNYGAYVQDLASNDRGDQSLGGIFSTSVGGVGSAGIRYESGGGLKLGKLKITGGEYALDLMVADGAATSICLASAVSFESQSVANVRLGRAGTTGTFDDVYFGEFEFKVNATKTNVIVQAGVRNVGFANGVMTGSGAGSIGIDVQGGTNVTVGGGVTIANVETPIKDNGAAATRLKIDHDAVIYSNVTNNPLIVSKTTTYTIDRTNRYVVADATSGSFTVTLPTAVGAEGFRYAIKQTNTGANVVTVGTTSSQTIDGVTTVGLTPLQALEVVSDGANWRAI